MGRKEMSDMTSSEFVAMCGALKRSYHTVAKALGRSPPMVSLYVNGKARIPRDVANKMHDMIAKRSKELAAWGYKNQSTDNLGSMIVASNELYRTKGADERLPALRRRFEPENTTVYPAYRLAHGDFGAYCVALSAWHAEAKGRRLRACNEHDIKAYDRELADLRVLADNAKGLSQRGAPYDIFITHSEWFVVSRALRHAGPVAYAFYQHWRHHKGHGHNGTGKHNRS
jgi:predicted transcriptional regulator